MSTGSLVRANTRPIGYTDDLPCLIAVLITVRLSLPVAAIMRARTLVIAARLTCDRRRQHVSALQSIVRTRSRHSSNKSVSTRSLTDALVVSGKGCAPVFPVPPNGQTSQVWSMSRPTIPLTGGIAEKSA